MGSLHPPLHRHPLPRTTAVPDHAAPAAPLTVAVPWGRHTQVRARSLTQQPSCRTTILQGLRGVRRSPIAAPVCLGTIAAHVDADDCGRLANLAHNLEGEPEQDAHLVEPLRDGAAVQLEEALARQGCGEGRQDGGG